MRTQTASRLFLTLLILLSSFVIMTFDGKQVAYACTCIGPGQRTTEEKVNAALAVFHGEVIKNEIVKVLEDGIETEYYESTILVREVWKGEDLPVTLKQRARVESYGASCERTFLEGTEFIFFTSVNDGYFSASICGSEDIFIGYSDEHEIWKFLTTLDSYVPQLPPSVVEEEVVSQPISKATPYMDNVVVLLTMGMIAVSLFSILVILKTRRKV